MRTTCGFAAAVILGLGIVGGVHGQLPRLFGPRTAGGARGMEIPPGSVVSGSDIRPGRRDLRVGADDYNRLLEILVELAWLGDPLTCPYLLEARVTGSKLQVRGHVPDLTIREQALKIARLHCPMAVLDGLTQQSGLASRPVPLPAAQLRQAATAALSAVFPEPEHAFDVHCTVDGQIHLAGFAVSFEEKLAVSKCLQRLHGCAAIINTLHVVADLHERAGLIVPASAAGAGVPGSPAATAGTPQAPPQPGHAIVLLSEGDYAAAGTVHLLRRRIAAVCGLDQKLVRIEFKSAGEVAVYLKVAPAEAARLTPRILHLPEVFAYRIKIYGSN